MTVQSADDWETECPARDDRHHCVCWYDGKPCCACGEAMDFGQAIQQLRKGFKVQRIGWNGKNMWLALQVPHANSKMTLPYIYMFTADKNLVPWLASQTDILATDWQVVES